MILKNFRPMNYKSTTKTNNIILYSDLSDEEKEDLFSKAKKRVMYILGIRAYSRGELLNKLLVSYPAEICEAVLEWVGGYGYIDDRDYAEKRACYLIYKKRYGLHKVKWDLKQKMISEETIAEVLFKYDGDDLRTEIMEILKQKYSEKLDERKDAEKVINALSRRGYGYDDIKHCISEFKDNLELDYD